MRLNYSCVCSCVECPSGTVWLSCARVGNCDLKTNSNTQPHHRHHYQDLIELCAHNVTHSMTLPVGVDGGVMLRCKRTQTSVFVSGARARTFVAAAATVLWTWRLTAFQRDVLWHRITPKCMRACAHFITRVAAAAALINVQQKKTRRIQFVRRGGQRKTDTMFRMFRQAWYICYTFRRYCGVMYYRYETLSLACIRRATVFLFFFISAISKASGGVVCFARGRERERDVSTTWLMTILYTIVYTNSNWTHLYDSPALYSIYKYISSPLHVYIVQLIQNTVNIFVCTSAMAHTSAAWFDSTMPHTQKR